MINLKQLALNGELCLFKSREKGIKSFYSSPEGNGILSTYKFNQLEKLVCTCGYFTTRKFFKEKEIRHNKKCKVKELWRKNRAEN